MIDEELGWWAIVEVMCESCHAFYEEYNGVYESEVYHYCAECRGEEEVE